MSDLIIKTARHDAAVESASEKGTLFLIDQMDPPYIIRREHVEDFAVTVQKDFGLEVEIK